ncbi:methylated-DNA--[protein]-cysteine S-methyltransferase [Eremococcus coleocola]|uniref:methylated-DNA--[protein]-cysteine S-methyltransferase n=1 Tax=Eremococcus coleocola ACS-139-V-Col8 TaxID=908337 RepID=E4KR39_9LACT|nr:methylated-DNA--[protein]-cysteine S-methyltransferase [Eremococcus coleocola]EFR30563.1 6-O-methylguanine DNA methyltransferase, DNA binding domain protein [Eremococcus coleocola ACS-139-V-Col8]
MNQIAIYPFPYGLLQIEYTEDQILSIANVDNFDGSSQTSSLSDQAFIELSEFMEGKRKEFNLPYLLDGTDFQKKVWSALLDIPYGQTKTYQEVAEIIGQPNAVRAVGAACRDNKLLMLIPCHRVVGSNGDLKGYAGGVQMKSDLLAIEGPKCKC